MIDATLRFIQADYASHRLRLCAEGLGLLVSISVSLIFASTTPHIPLVTCYLLWMIGSGLLVTTSWSRGSVGLTALYGSFLVIDGIGFIRTLLA